MKTKELKITKSEAEWIFQVLDEGMPDEQDERDAIAFIWVKLKNFLKNEDS